MDFIPYEVHIEIVLMNLIRLLNQIITIHFISASRPGDYGA